MREARASAVCASISVSRSYISPSRELSSASSSSLSFFARAFSRWPCATLAAPAADASDSGSCSGSGSGSPVVVVAVVVVVVVEEEEGTASSAAVAG